MKICFLIADISAKGGTERVTSIIANGLTDRKFEVDIISCKNDPSSFFALNKKIKIHSLRAEKIESGFWRKLTNIKSIWKLANQRKYDAIIAVDVYLYLYLIPLQITKRSRCIAWEHFNCNICSSKFTNLARMLAAKFADKIVVLGKQDFESYSRKYKNATNIVYIYNPLAFSKIANKNISNHRVVAAGRLAEQKGFDLLIDAWNIVEKKDANSDWILDIYGTGKLEAQLNNQITEYGLKRVYLRGYADNIDIEYLNSSIFVLSSRFEGFVLVLIEALACGLPCVSFDCPMGPREIVVDGVNGYLVENGNVEQMADRLLRLMQDEELRKKFSANAHNNLQRFELQEVLNSWEAILNPYSKAKGNKIL